MASIFGHAISAWAIGSWLPAPMRTVSFWLLAVACTVLPDADVLAFKLGIPYEHVLGHRGITHSIPFGLVAGFLLGWIFFRKKATKTTDWIITGLVLALCWISHGVLDGMTNGGLGVAYFAPFDVNRYFLPWRPIQVSPLGVSRFFSSWGIQVLVSELVWIVFPTLFIVLFARLFHWFNRSN
jgi:inner membrane protein